MVDYDLSSPIDAELVSYGMEDCPCDATAYYETLPPCVVCGDELNITRPHSHIHFKGGMYHDLCLTLALLRQLTGR